MCLLASALDVAANGEGLALRERLPARAGVRYLATIVATTIRSTSTIAPLLPGQRAIRVACRPCAWDAQGSRSGIELEAHLRVEVVGDRKEQIVAG